MLRIERIKVSYGEVPALHEISFQVAPKQIVSIIGANGAGKSTILKAISGLLRLDGGSIFFENQRTDLIAAHRLVEMGVAHVPEAASVALAPQVPGARARPQSRCSRESRSVRRAPRDVFRPRHSARWW